MDESAAWLAQARSGRDAGETLIMSGRGASLCHTEYPFVAPDGEWTFPAAERVFSDNEVNRFRQLTHDLLAGVGRVVSALRRRPS